MRERNPTAFKELDCRNALYVNSIQAYWRTALPRDFGKQYQPAKTVFFARRGQHRLRPGRLRRRAVLLPGRRPGLHRPDLLHELLADRFGAKGEFAQPYVLAHEYGHHVQDLLGTEAQMRRQQQRDPDHANALSVKLELQADCYAGVWAKHATEHRRRQRPADLQEHHRAGHPARRCDTAATIGDDTIQKRGGGTVNPDEFTHGSSAQRQKWFKHRLRHRRPEVLRHLQRAAVTTAGGAV